MLLHTFISSLKNYIRHSFEIKILSIIYSSSSFLEKNFYFNQIQWLNETVFRKRILKKKILY